MSKFQDGDTAPAPVDKEIICHCSGTTKQQIAGLINKGIDDLGLISRKTGANAGCGACEDTIQTLIAEYSENPKGHPSAR